MAKTEAVVTIQMIRVPKPRIPVYVWGCDDRIASPFGRLGVNVEHDSDRDVLVSDLALEISCELDCSVVPIWF